MNYFNSGIKAIESRILIKLENIQINKTPSGIIYDKSKLDGIKSTFKYGHIFSIDDKDSEQYKLKIGDRVYFDSMFGETIKFNKKSNGSYIPLVLIAIHPEGILAKATEQFNLMDI